MLTVDSMPALRSTACEVALVEPGEVAEVLDDLLDPLEPLAGPLGQARPRLSSV